jgi:hypothetical protein
MTFRLRTAQKTPEGVYHYLGDEGLSPVVSRATKYATEQAALIARDEYSRVRRNVALVTEEC